MEACANVSKSRTLPLNIMLVGILLLTTFVRFISTHPLVESTTLEAEEWSLPEEYQEFGMRLSRRMDIMHSPLISAPDGGLLMAAVHQRPKVESSSNSDSNRARDARDTPLAELRNRILRHREKVVGASTPAAQVTTAISASTVPDHQDDEDYIEDHEDMEKHASELVPFRYNASTATVFTTTNPTTSTTTTSTTPNWKSTTLSETINPSTLSSNSGSNSSDVNATTEKTRTRPLTLTRSPYHRPLPVIIKASDEAVSRVQHTEILRERTRTESLQRQSSIQVPNATAASHHHNALRPVPLVPNVHTHLGGANRINANETTYKSAKPNLTPIRRIMLRNRPNSTETGHSSKGSTSTNTNTTTTTTTTTQAPTTTLPLFSTQRMRNSTTLWATKKEVTRAFLPLQKERENNATNSTTKVENTTVSPDATMEKHAVNTTVSPSIFSTTNPINPNREKSPASLISHPSSLQTQTDMTRNEKIENEGQFPDLASVNPIEASLSATFTPTLTVNSFATLAQLFTTSSVPNGLQRLSNVSPYVTHKPTTLPSSSTVNEKQPYPTVTMITEPIISPTFVLAVESSSNTVSKNPSTTTMNSTLGREVALIPFTLEDAVRPYNSDSNQEALPATSTANPRLEANHAVESDKLDRGELSSEQAKLPVASEVDILPMAPPVLPSMYDYYPFHMENRNSPSVTQPSAVFQADDNLSELEMTEDSVSPSTFNVHSYPNPSTSHRPLAIEDILNIQNMLGTETNAFLRPKPTFFSSEPSSTPVNAVVKVDNPPSASSEQVEPVPVHENDQIQQTTTSIYIIGVVGIVPVAGALVWLIKFQLNRRKERLNESDTSSESEFRNGRKSSAFLAPVPIPAAKAHRFAHGASDKEDLMPYNARNCQLKASPWEFPRSKVKLQTLVGEGYFGQVWKAEAEDICGYQGTLLVAAKLVKDGASPKEKQELLKEMNIMQQLGPHPNVVALVGCCTEQEPYLLIMEYVMFGRLLTFLRDHRTQQRYYNFSRDAEALTSRDLTTFAYCVAKGMEYIASKGIVHRDLAARNVLVDHNKMCKVADFGMSRNVKDTTGEMYEQRVKGALPIRWMAPESLVHSVFTQKSDVWSFGVLLWEIVTLGSTPYPGMEAREVMRKVRDGYKPDRPSHCRPELYRLMQKCWHSDPSRRPDFSELRSDLAHLLDDAGGYVDLDQYQDDAYMNLEPPSDESEKV